MVLTLADAIAMARRNSPRIQEASAVTNRARAGALTARAYTNPSVEIYEGDQYSRPVKNPGTPGLLQHYAVSQTIEIPTERRARKRAAQFGIASSQAGEQSLVLSVVADAKHAFYNALRQREEIQH
jgi:cobalt-zinc-cadmium efflux system outer membrane protein